MIAEINEVLVTLALIVWAAVGASVLGVIFGAIRGR